MDRIRRRLSKSGSPVIGRPNDSHAGRLCVLWALLAALGTASAHAREGATASTDRYPDEWYYYNSQNPSVQRARQLEGQPAPTLHVADWIGEAQDLDKLRGKVVVVDFWGNWCGPCMKAIPKTNELAKRYRDQGLVVMGIHSSRGAEGFARAVKQMQISYPSAVDQNNASATAWRVGFWPTYAIIDRHGVVRAIGIKPEHVEDAVVSLLGDKAATPLEKNPQSVVENARPPVDNAQRAVEAPAVRPGDALPVQWLEGSADKRRRFDRMLASDKAPTVASGTWLNSEPLTLEDLRGKVVLLDFWATWCGPCIRSVPKVNLLQAKYGDQGLVVIGVCHQQGMEKMGQVAQQHAIEYPICADEHGAMGRSYQVDSYPDYYLIDRTGRLRIADCNNATVEQAIQMLLAEGEGSVTP